LSSFFVAKASFISFNHSGPIKSFHRYYVM